MADLIDIDHEYDKDGNELEGYRVVLDGEPADLYGISEDYFDEVVDAHEFAVEVSEETGTPITWTCMKPGWA